MPSPHCRDSGYAELWASWKGHGSLLRVSPEQQQQQAPFSVEHVQLFCVRGAGALYTGGPLNLTSHCETPRVTVILSQLLETTPTAVY